jgi:hypothetical protein
MRYSTYTFWVIVRNPLVLEDMFGCDKEDLAQMTGIRYTSGRSNYYTKLILL